MYWKLASLAIFAIFCAWVWYESHRTVNIAKKREEEFWEREREANSTRRKPIDHLDYIKLPKDLPYELHTDNDDISACIRTIKELEGENILNLTGYSNTDLKLEYGAPNITELSRCDQNYTTLVTTFQKWADELLNLGEEAEAVKLMEFCVRTKCDVGKTYRLLAKYYLNNGEIDKYNALLTTIDETKSINKEHIKESLYALKV